MQWMGREVAGGAFRAGAAGYDLSGTRFLAKPAVLELLALSRRGPVRLRLAEESQPYVRLRNLFGSSLRQLAPGLWEITGK